MASAFWTFEDGRGFADRWTGMALMLELITNELKQIKGTEAFYEYLEYFVYREEKGDSYNGYGGFIRGEENIMFNIDLRTFTPENRILFWKATQMALTKIKKENNEEMSYAEYGLTTILDMHKHIKKGEPPSSLTHYREPMEDSGEKLGPGWEGFEL